MLPRPALTELGKLIASNPEGSGDELIAVGELLASNPNSLIDTLELLAKETRKKRRDDGLVEAFGMMVCRALEILRYGVERNHTAAANTLAVVRKRLLALVTRGSVDPNSLLLILSLFAGAKVDPGGELQAALEGTAKAGMLPPVATGDIYRGLAEMANLFDGDVFAFQAQLAEQTAILPDGQRAGMAAALLAASEPSLWEAAVGWLLDAGPATREDAAGLLQQAAAVGRISPVMLRRLITIRNWLPEKDRASVDGIVRACRRKGIECAPAAPVETRQVLATGIDGSGAQSAFAIVKDGRKQAAGALLIKLGVGVRDAWVNAALSKREAEAFLYQVVTQTSSYDSSLDFIRLALGHALGIGRESGALPPFGLVGFVERVGLMDIDPMAIAVDALVARLVDEITAKRRTSAMVGRALEASAAWDDKFLFSDSWFEDDGAVDAMLDGRRLSAKRRAGLILDNYLPARRSHWAELLAWTAATLREDDSTGDNWMDFTLVARELLEDRPLAEIPLMSVIADRTVEAWHERGGRSHS